MAVTLTINVREKVRKEGGKETGVRRGREGARELGGYREGGGKG